MKKFLCSVLLVLISVLFVPVIGLCSDTWSRVHVLVEDTARTTITVSSDGAVDTMSIIIKLRDANVDSGIWYQLYNQPMVYVDDIKNSPYYNPNTRTFSVDYQIPHNSGYTCNSIACVGYYFYLWYGSNEIGEWNQVRCDTGLLLLQ